MPHLIPSDYPEPLPAEPWPTPIVAVRAFRVVGSDLFPMTNSSPDPWAPVGEWDTTTPHQYCIPWKRENGVSFDFCVCGFHAWHTQPAGVHRMVADYYGIDRAFAEVELAGTVIEHELGWRATKARITRILYRTERDEFVASGRGVLSPPSTLIDQLLATYRKDNDGQDWSALEAHRSGTGSCPECAPTYTNAITNPYFSVSTSALSASQLYRIRQSWMNDDAEARRREELHKERIVNQYADSFTVTYNDSGYNRFFNPIH